MRGLTKRTRVILCLAGLAGAAAAAEPPVEFTGVLVENGRPKIALTDKTTKTTRWVDPGGAFKGYTVARYVANEDAVVLRKDGQEYRLLLVPPKSGETTPASAAASKSAVAMAPSPPVPAPPVPVPPVPAAPATAPAASPNPGPASTTAASTATGASATTPPASLPPTGPVLAPEPPAASVPPVAPASAPAAAAANGPGGSAAVTRAVAPGETLESIAGRSGITVPQLKALNPTLNESSLQPGQVIRIQ